MAGRLPALGDLSIGTPFFPGGNVAYLFGSYAMTRADSVPLRPYVEAASARIIPWRQDANGRDAFGESFHARWRAWRDSVMRVESGVRIAGDASETLTHEGYTARFPRFTPEGALVYVADRRHLQYAGKLPPTELLKLVRQGRGSSGENPDYVLQTHAHLRKMGIYDPVLAALAQELAPGLGAPHPSLAG